MPNEQLDQREGGRQRKSRERRGGGEGDDKVFHCSRCVCVDRTLLYLHKARAGGTLWDSRRCTEEDFPRMAYSIRPSRYYFFQRRAPSNTFSVARFLIDFLCFLSVLSGKTNLPSWREEEKKKKKRGGGETGDLLEQSGALLLGWKKSGE